MYRCNVYIYIYIPNSNVHTDNVPNNIPNNIPNIPNNTPYNTVLYDDFMSVYTQFSDTNADGILRSYAKVAEIFEHLTEECAAEAWVVGGCRWLSQNWWSF